MTFIESWLEGPSLAIDIYDWINQWHEDTETTKTLSEYLGITDAEYAQWLENPKCLMSILNKYEINS